jgi:hypothetical protein
MQTRTAVGGSKVMENSPDRIGHGVLVCNTCTMISKHTRFGARDVRAEFASAAARGKGAPKGLIACRSKKRAANSQ